MGIMLDILYNYAPVYTQKIIRNRHICLLGNCTHISCVVVYVKKGKVLDRLRILLDSVLWRSSRQLLLINAHTVMQENAGKNT